MAPWYYRRIRFIRESGRDIPPFQAPAGNWVFFWISVRCADPIFPQTHYSMSTIGLDGIE